MDKVNFEELQDILKQAQLTIYNVDAPDDVNGFRFFTITQFVEFLKNCDIKNCFLSTAYSSIEDYMIDEQMVEDAVDIESNLGQKVLKKVKEYNNSLRFVDFSVPEEILVVALYEGKYFYFEYFHDVCLDNLPLLQPEDKMEEILNLFNEELYIERSRKKEVIEQQMEKLKQYILTDPDFCLCKNKELRKNYVKELFKNKIGSEFKELKAYWSHVMETGDLYIYKGAFHFIELLWNGRKSNK